MPEPVHVLLMKQHWDAWSSRVLQPNGLAAALCRPAAGELVTELIKACYTLESTEQHSREQALL
jgi:hypothetical protein